MGQYLVIGIATRISANKERVMNEFQNVDKFKTQFEKTFNESGNYQLEETDNYYYLNLKSEVADKEWVDFLRSFYKLRYTRDCGQDDVIEALSQSNDLKSKLDIAKAGGHFCYRADYYPYYLMENPYSYRDMLVGVDMVILSTDGKIVMECYHDLFDFFARLIRQELKDFRLAGSLMVEIWG